MRFLDGFKTVIGVVGLFVVALSDASVLPLLPERSRPYVTGAAATFLALGLMHKAEKARDRRDARIMHENVMRRVREEAKRDGSEDA